MTMAPSLEDQPTNDHYLALLAEHGWPQIKGGSPELDEEPGDAGSDTPEAPDGSDQPSGEEESLEDFDYSGIPDDQRESVEKRIKGFQSSYTKAMQSVAEARREAEQAQQLQEALRNPQVAPAILAQLGYTPQQVVEMVGYELPDEEDDDEPDLYQEVQGLKQTLAQRDEAEQAAAQEEALTDHVSGEIERLETKAGYEFTKEEHQALDALSRQFPKEQAGRLVPDVENAFVFLESLGSAAKDRLLKGKTNTPRPPGGGKPGSRTVDLSKETKEQRMERMQQAAEEAAGSAA